MPDYFLPPFLKITHTPTPLLGPYRMFCIGDFLGCQSIRKKKLARPAFAPLPVTIFRNLQMQLFIAGKWISPAKWLKIMLLFKSTATEAGKNNKIWQHYWELLLWAEQKQKNQGSFWDWRNKMIKNLKSQKRLGIMYWFDWILPADI